MKFSTFRKGNFVYISEKQKAICVVNDRLLENIRKLIPVNLSTRILVDYGFIQVTEDIFYMGDSSIVIENGKFILNQDFEIENLHELQNILFYTNNIELKKPL